MYATEYERLKTERSSCMERYISFTKSNESDLHKKVALQNSSVSKEPFSNHRTNDKEPMNDSQRNVNQSFYPRSVYIEPEFSEPIEEFTKCDFENSSTNIQTQLLSKNVLGKQTVNRNCRSLPYDVPPKRSAVYKIDTLYNKGIYKNQYPMYSPNLNNNKIPQMFEHINAQQYSASQYSGSRNPYMLTVHTVPSFSNYQNIHFPFYHHNQGDKENSDNISFPYVPHKQSSDHIANHCTVQTKQHEKINLSGSCSSPNIHKNYNFQHKAPHTVNQNTEHFSLQNNHIVQDDRQKKFEIYKKRTDNDKEKAKAVTGAKEVDNKKQVTWLSQVNVKPKLQHFIGSVEQVIRWHQMTKKLDLHAFYETTGTFESMRNGKYFSQRILFIRGGSVYSRTVLQAVFYAIDRELPQFQKGQLITCVGRMIGGNKLHIFDAWETTKEFQNGIKRVSSLCQRILQEATM